MLSNTLLKIFLLSLPFFLTACFDLEHRLVIKDGEPVTFNFAFSLDTTLLAGDAGIDADSKCANDTFDKELPEGLIVVSDVRVESGVLYCDYAVTGELKAFTDFSAELQREGGRADIIQFERLDDDRVKIVSRYDFREEEVGEAADDSALAASMRRMVASNFEGHKISWKVEAPTVLESNGEIAVDGRSVTWSIPLDEAIAAGDEYRFEAILDIKNYHPRFF